jgi:hypothetical protein
MKSKKVKLLAGTLAAALVIGSFSTNYAGAEVRGITGAVAPKKKKTVSKKKTRVVVKTASELNNALKNSANKEISLKSDKKITLNLKGNHKGVKLIISAPKAEITNRGRFKIIEINGKKWVEKARGNSLIVKSAKTGIEVSKNAKAAYIRFLKSGAKAHVSVNGEVKSLIVDKKAELKLTGKTELVSVVVNAGGTKITSGVQVEITATKNTEAVLKKGAEGSSVKASDNKVKVVVKNETKEEVFVENAAGDETVLESGAYKELKNGIVADKGKSGNSLDNTVSLNDDTTPLGDANIAKPAEGAIVSVGVYPAYTYEDKKVEFEDNNLKEYLLVLLKGYKGDEERDDMKGEYVIKLTDTSFRKNPKDTEIYESEMAKIEALTFTGWDKDYENEITVKSIKGLEKAVNLKMLTFSSSYIPEAGDIRYSASSISGLNPLKDLKKLEFLRLSHNNIEDVTPLKDLTNLKHLYISHNRIADVSSLGKLTNLVDFDISINYIADVSVAKNYNKMTMFNAIRNKITDISALKDITGLLILNVKQNDVKDIDCIKDLVKLETLNLEDNKNISDIKVIKNLTKLKELNLNNCGIDDADVTGDIFAGLTKAVELDLSNNKLTSVDFLANCNELNNLYLDNNKLTSLDVLRDKTKLTALRFSGNEVSDITPLAGHTGLTELRFSKNKVEDIAVISAFSELGSIELNGNKVYDFTPLSGLTSLYEAVIDGQNVDYKGEAAKVSDLTAEMDSPVKGLASIGAANIKAASSDSNIKVALEEGKLKFTLNETAGAELKAKGEKKIDLTFSFRNEKDFSYLSFPDGEPNNSITVKGIVLK